MREMLADKLARLLSKRPRGIGLASRDAEQTFNMLFVTTL